MIKNSLLQKIFFRIRSTYSCKPYLRKIYWKMQGAYIGENTNLPHVSITWPHQLKIGANCILEDNIFFKYDGIWQPGPSIVVEDKVFIGRGCEFNIRKNINVGSNCLIASGCKFIDHDHGTDNLSIPISFQQGPELPIVINENVWLGVECGGLKGCYYRKKFNRRRRFNCY